MPYLLDANVFIQPHKQYYHPTICSAYWDWLDHAHHEKIAFSVERVRDEIKDDELVTWLSTRRSFFVPPDGRVLQSLRLTNQWAAGSGRFVDRAVRQYTSVADSYLVAHAHAYGFTVVTFEVRDPRCRTRVKIPDACDEPGVDCVNPFVMLRREGAHFALRS